MASRIALRAAKQPMRTTLFANQRANITAKRSFSSSQGAKQKNYWGIGALAAGALIGTALFTQQQLNAEEENKKRSGLDPKEFQEFTVKEIIPYNHNTQIYRFALQDPNAELGLPVASCVVVKANIGEGGKPVIRPYTPISSNDDKGYFDFLIKEYPQGVMSKHFAHLKVGDKLEVKGPIPKIAVKPQMKKKIGMVAGGTGITPMYQVANELLKHDDKTELTLVFANISEQDILLRERFDALAKKHKNFRVHYVLEKAPANWNGSVGYFNKDIAKKWLPEPSNDNLILVCGPPGMMKAVSGEKAPDYSQGEVGGILKDLGYTKEQVFKF